MRRVLWGVTMTLALASGVGLAEAVQVQEAALASGVGLTETARAQEAAGAGVWRRTGGDGPSAGSGAVRRIAHAVGADRFERRDVR